MLISCILPAYNSAAALAQSVSAIQATAPADTEILVVDDASTDATPEVAARLGCRVIKLEKNSGPAAARNCGAKYARGDILFFVDADVVLHSDAIERVVSAFENDHELAAVFGSYDATPSSQSVISLYRNLLHHFVHQNGKPEASTFWAGCGAMRRSVFEGIGGFDEKQFPYPSIEDIELGYRLRRTGHRILLDKSLLGKHLKHWTLRSVIVTDIKCRALPWSRLILANRGACVDLNLRTGQKLSAVLVMMAFMLLFFGFYRGEVLVLSAALILAVGVLNRDLYRFFFHRHGFLFVSACIPLHLFYYLYSSLIYLFVWLTFHCNAAAKRPLRTIHSR